MPTITIQLDDLPAIDVAIVEEDTAIDAFAVFAHRFGLDHVTITAVNDPIAHLDPKYDVVVEVEADLTPPHGINRPTTTPTATDGADIRDAIRKSVGCPRCNASTAWPCHSKKGQNYPDFIHQARIDAWNRRP